MASSCLLPSKGDMVIGGVKFYGNFQYWIDGIWSLGPFSSDSPSQLDILWHDGHTLGVDGAQVGVLEKTNEVGLGCFLKVRKLRD